MYCNVIILDPVISLLGINLKELIEGEKKD